MTAQARKPLVLDPEMVARDLARLRAVGAVQTVAPKPLPPELAPVLPFPMEALPRAFAPWVRDVAERMQCPADFVAVPMLVSAASLVARRIGIRPEARSDWIERGNLWGLIVGRPGWMKSPAMAQALAPIERLEARAAEAFKARLAEFKAEQMAAEMKGKARETKAKEALRKNPDADVRGLLMADQEAPEPTRPRYVVNDLTYESAGVLLEANPDGLLCVRDEMRGLFLSLAGEDAAAARAFFLQAWSGGRYTFDRIGRGITAVDDARLSIIGGIQPGPLADLVHRARRGASDDGMLERFLVSWPDAAGEWRSVDRLPDADAKRQAWGVFERLDALTPERVGAEWATDFQGAPEGLPFLRFTLDALEQFLEWRTELEGKLRAGDASDGLEGALSKFRHHVPALALAIHVIDGGVGPVNHAAVLRALELADYFESHARRVHGSGKLPIKAARLILAKAKAGDLLEAFTARDVYRKHWSGLSDLETVTEALDLLAEHDWLIESTIGEGGRRSVAYSLTEGARRG